MSEAQKPSERSWPRGFGEHQLQQMRRLAALPLWAKLEWLEEAQRMASHIEGAASEKRGDDPNRRP